MFHGNSQNSSFLTMLKMKIRYILLKRKNNIPNFYMIAHSVFWPENYFASLVLRSWGQAGCQKKRKTSRNMNFLVWVAVFQLNLNKLRKTTKKWRFSILFGPILDVFEDFSNLTEKQQLKPKNSCTLRFLASFGTQLDHRSERLVEWNNSEVKKPCVEMKFYKS